MEPTPSPEQILERLNVLDKQISELLDEKPVSVIDRIKAYAFPILLSAVVFFGVKMTNKLDNIDQIASDVAVLKSQMSFYMQLNNLKDNLRSDNDSPRQMRMQGFMSEGTLPKKENYSLNPLPQ